VALELNTTKEPPHYLDDKPCRKTFARDPGDVKGDGRHQEGEACDPVLEEEKLGDGPEEVSGVHRVADPLADAGGHEPVVLSDLKPRREAFGEVSVRPPQKPGGLEEEGAAGRLLRQVCASGVALHHEFRSINWPSQVRP